MISAPQANRYSYAGDGATTAFAYNSIFQNLDDLLVLSVVNNTPTTFVRGTNYTVSGGSGATGTVTTTVPVPVGTTLVIIGNPPVQQSLHLVGGGAAPAAAQETAYDFLTELVQRVADKIARSFVLPDFDTSGISLALPAPLSPGDMFCVNPSGTALGGFPSVASRKGMLLGFDNANGLPIPVASVLTGVIASAFGNNFVQAPTAAIAAGVLASSQSTVTAAGTTNINATSAVNQVFTGTTTQQVNLPNPISGVTNIGQSWIFQNLSTGIVTVKTVGGNTIQAMAANTQLVVTDLTLNSVTDTTAWNWVYLPLNRQIAYADVVPFASSQVLCDSPNGHGATNTNIRRFTNAVSTGSDITYADSATLGATFTINKAGLYFMAYTDVAAAATCAIGMSVNSAQLTTSIGSITTANRIMGSTGAVGLDATVAGVHRAAVNDVIRAHTNANPDATGAFCQFRIIRIA